MISCLPSSVHDSWIYNTIININLLLNQYNIGPMCDWYLSQILYNKSSSESDLFSPLYIAVLQYWIYPMTISFIARRHTMTHIQICSIFKYVWFICIYFSQNHPNSTDPDQSFNKYLVFVINRRLLTDVLRRVVSSSQGARAQVMWKKKVIDNTTQSRGTSLFFYWGIE